MGNMRSYSQRKHFATGGYNEKKSFAVDIPPALAIWKALSITLREEVLNPGG
jgi:hypothetical protein